jgi:hypothetical protein
VLPITPMTNKTLGQVERCPSPIFDCVQLSYREYSGAGDRGRTDDNHVGNVALYQLSYTRIKSLLRNYLYVINTLMEYVYKLNLPPLDVVLREDRVSLLSQIHDKPQFTTYNPTELIKPEFMTINDITWDLALDLFKPPNHIGLIHSDSLESDTHVWGINWIWGASGIMRYWNIKNISSNEIPKEHSSGIGRNIFTFSTDKPHDKMYHMNPGAYLVNGSVPHQPNSLGNRHCISVRCDKTYNLPWENVVELFQDYIL